MAVGVERSDWVMTFYRSIRQLFSLQLSGLVLLLCFLFGGLSGCSSENKSESQIDDEVPCLTELPPVDCAPLYTPDFENVFNNTLNKSCTAGGGSCHSTSGAKGGLSFSDKSSAYARLTTPIDGVAMIQEDDLLCSPLLKRLGTTDSKYVMPPGNPLDANELCAVVTWIRNGAKP